MVYIRIQHTRILNEMSLITEIRKNKRFSIGDFITYFVCFFFNWRKTFQFMGFVRKLSKAKLSVAFDIHSLKMILNICHYSSIRPTKWNEKERKYACHSMILISTFLSTSMKRYWTFFIVYIYLYKHWILSKS